MALKTFKRGATWYIRGTVAGQRFYRSLKTPDRDCADQLKAKIERDAWQGHIYGPASVKTFAEAAFSYIRDRRPGPGDHRYLKALLAHFGERRLLAIDQAALDQAYAAILKADAKPATKIRNVLTPLQAILNHAAARGWCGRPAFQRPRQVQRTPRWLRPDEAECLIEAAAPHLRPLIVFLIATGARLSEALYLDWRDVDLTGRFVIFRATKTGGDRAVPLSDRALVALANLKRRDGAVFLKPGGRPYQDREKLEGGQIKTAWAGACKRAGLAEPRQGIRTTKGKRRQVTLWKPLVTPHACRHSFATWLYADTKDLLRVKKYGGWSKLATVEIYMHLAPESLAIPPGWLPRSGAKSAEAPAAEGSKIGTTNG